MFHVLSRTRVKNETTLGRGLGWPDDLGRHGDLVFMVMGPVTGEINLNRLGNVKREVGNRLGYRKIYFGN